MCDVATQQALETAVDSKVNNAEAFTAYDITLAARNASGLNIRHSHVKHDVHDVIASRATTYQRSLISLPGVPVQPFLYHPPGYDLNSYSPASQAGGQSVVNVTQAQNQTAVAMNPAPAYVTPGATNDPDVITQDNRGRLWIPARLISGLGVQYSSPVHVTQSTIPDLSDATGQRTLPVLRITTAVPAGATEAVEYLVDRHANIAISRGVLVDAGLDGKGKYKLEGTATEIVVKVA